MSRIIALCMEDCHPSTEASRYLRCCALTGLQPGLALTADGVVQWRSGAPAAVRLVVSLDEKLVCYREEGAPGGTRVHRGGRFVEVEELKPVVLLDGDELTLGDRRLRLHVHGFTSTAHDPEFYVVPEPTSVPSGAVRAAAVAGIAVAGILGAAGCDKPPPDKPVEKPPIDVRDQPPAPLPPPPPPMEVRDTPPVAPPPEEVAPPPPPPPPPPMEPVMLPPPIEMRPHPPVKPIPRPDDRPRTLPSTPEKPRP